jgi:hypothetical protein
MDDDHDSFEPDSDEDDAIGPIKALSPTKMKRKLEDPNEIDCHVLIKDRVAR